MRSLIASRQRQVLAPAVIEATGPSLVTTTLYDLIASIQAGAAPDEDRAVVARVDNLLRTGRMTFLKNVTALKAYSSD